MNGVNGHYGQPNPWQEYKSPDGRVYFYNALTKATQWTKPEEMMSPAEVCFPRSHKYVTPYTNQIDSALWQTSRGKNTLLKVVVSIGTILKRSKVPGRCLRSTERPWVMRLLPLHLRKSPIN